MQVYFNAFPGSKMHIFEAITKKVNLEQQQDVFKGVHAYKQDVHILSNTLVQFQEYQ